MEDECAVRAFKEEKVAVAPGFSPVAIGEADSGRVACLSACILAFGSVEGIMIAFSVVVAEGRPADDTLEESSEDRHPLVLSGQCNDVGDDLKIYYVYQLKSLSIRENCAASLTYGSEPIFSPL